MKIKELILYIVCWTIIILTSLMLLVGVVRVFVCDRFIVRGSSMYPTLYDDEPVWVNKLLLGARIYKSFDTESPVLESFRMPGLRRIHVGDVAIFNNPYGRDREKIEFRINYVYLKRCVGCPGDTIGIKDCHFYNTRVEDVGLDATMEHMLAGTPDTLLSYPRGIFPFVPELGWTMKEMGPLVVPCKGMTVALDSISVRIYEKTIEYETGERPLWDGGRCLHAGQEMDCYTFAEDYCYFVGDNVLNSRDSRYFGFVPEDYIIGLINPR